MLPQPLNVAKKWSIGSARTAAAFLFAAGLVSATASACSSSGAHGSSSKDTTGSCGTCPTGFTCGAANGTPVCFSPTGIPQFSNVVIIMMENTTLATLQAAGNAPYLTGLSQSWATSSNYHGATHPSLRNYIALTSGDPQGIGDDGILHREFCDCHPTGSACSALNCVVALVPLGNCGCPINARNLADDIESAGLTWRDYGEGMGTPCNLTDNSGTSYAARHIPFLYYDDIQQSSRCASNVVDYSNFATDLASGLPTYSIIAPNLVHDMHDPFPAQAQNYANGDQWLSSQIPTILGERPWQAGGAGLLIVVWDEDDLSGGITQSTDDPIPMFLISPLAKKGGYSSATQYDHYSLLATIEDSLGLPRLLNASTAQPMADFFVNDSPATASDTADASARTASIPCAMASDCPDDQACDLSSQVCSAQCTSGNCACATDQQCNQATVVCTGGQCVAGCHVAGDCPSTQACQTNTDPGTCASPCSASSCACNADSQCSGIDDDGGTSDGGVGLICSEAGTCISGCNVASDCPSGMTCDTSTSPGTCQSAAADGG